MMGNAKVQIQRRDKKFGGDKLFIYLPKRVVDQEKIKVKDLVEFDMRNVGECLTDRETKPFQRRKIERDSKEATSGDVPGIDPANQEN